MPAASPATGPPKGGSSTVRSTRSGTATFSGATTTTRRARAAAVMAWSSRRRPATSTSGLETPPSRSARPPASTTASLAPARGSSVLTCRSVFIRVYSWSFVGPAPVAGTPAGLGDHPHGGDLGRTVHPLDHVHHRERGHRDRRHRLHLDAGAIRG